MIYQLINRFVSGESVYHDIIITDDVGEERFNSMKTIEGEEEDLVNSLYASIVYRRHTEANRPLILGIVAGMQTTALSQIKLGSMDLTKMMAINTIIRANLTPLGIQIDTPDLVGILTNRILDTIGKVNDLYNQIEVTDEIKVLTLSTIQQIAQVLNGDT